MRRRRGHRLGLVRAYHRLLVWDLTKRPWLTRTAERRSTNCSARASSSTPTSRPCIPPLPAAAPPRRGADRCGALTGPACAALPELPGVLTADQLRDTVAWIADQQEPDGALPWSRRGQLDPWDSIEAAMALDVGGEHGRAAAAIAGWPPGSTGRRVLGVGVPRGRGRRRRGEQPRRLPRRRHLAQLAVLGGRGPGRGAVAGGPPRPGPGDADAAGRGRDRLGAPPGRHPGRHRAPDGQRQPLPGAAMRDRARRAARRGAARLGAGGHRARHRAALPAGGLRRPVPLLHGLVLPGARRRGHRDRRRRAAGGRLGPVRRPPGWAPAAWPTGPG